MEMLRLTAGSLGILVFILFALCNSKYIIDFILWRKKSSLIPLVGGVMGAIGVTLLPYQQIHSYWWLPLIIDPGCGYLFVMQVWGLSFRRRTSD